MVAVPGRPFGRACFLILAVLIAPGCRSPRAAAPSPAAVGLTPTDTIDPTIPEPTALLRTADLANAGRLVNQQRGNVPQPRRTVLALSGGGMYGAYTAGVLCGWSEAGCRPRFDVVTGISTGALAGSLAFAGPEYDGQLRWFGTQLSADRVYRKKRVIGGLLSDSLADNTPLAEQIERVVTPEYLCRAGREHLAGRRFYVGTTDLETGRGVVWDMGAIAARGTPEDLVLYRKVLLASAAIPGFFPPVRIPVQVNGQCFEEAHVDGGVTASLFARPPFLPELGRNADPAAGELNGSDLYVVIAGKLHPEPRPVPRRAVKIAGASVSLLTYSQARDELVRLYAGAALAGMNFRLAALPDQFPVGAESTSFDLDEMRRMFEEGRRQILTGTAWRPAPPDEPAATRSGTRLMALPGQ